MTRAKKMAEHCYDDVWNVPQVIKNIESISIKKDERLNKSNQ